MNVKIFCLSIAVALMVSIATAQVSVTVNVPTAGGLGAAIKSAGDNKATITNLTVTGKIDARDVKFMRDSMPVLAVLDMAAVQIVSYSGTGGTVTSSTLYPANTMPQKSFDTYNFAAGIESNSILNTLVLPTSLKVIGNNAFNGCIGLKGTLIIPDPVTTIESYAFCTCYHLTGLVLSGSLETIGDNAFSTCYGLTCALSLPNSLKTIGKAAFDGCRFSGTLKIPNGITKITDRAFQSCKFSGLIIPNSINLIDWDAFGFCDSLKGAIIIPNSVTTIKEGFRYCGGINSFYLPNSVTSITGYANMAFAGCRGLRKFVIDKIVPLSIDTMAFSGVNKTTCELIVPAGSKAAYQSAKGWGLFQNITEAIFVTLNTQGGQPAAPILSSTANLTIAAPSNPVRDGYNFAGWYKETACTNAWNFATDVVTVPITLYAKWGSATGIENLQQNIISIYPNPVSNMLNIDNVAPKSVVSIISIGGKLFKTIIAANPHTEIPVNDLPAGVYFLGVNGSVSKFVKL